MKLDPRGEYYGTTGVEAQIAESKSSTNWLGHCFMITLLITIIMVYLKDNLLFESNGYPYLLALGLPVAILAVLAGFILYNGYISKL